VADTRLDGDAPIVTFANGKVMREPIITIDEAAMRIVWTNEGGLATHFNALAKLDFPHSRTCHRRLAHSPEDVL